ncbi:MAG: hypothetical protein E6767_12915 [Dysgonomonas sp.]|nr:hypothetical protein [Dysgonomonas sp.]
MAEVNKKYSKRFVIVFAIALVFFMACIGLISYLVDPFFQFRAKEGTTYFLNPRFVNGGLAKHYDYNTVVMGSSMMQNMNLSILRENDPSVKPVKLSTGGMNYLEMEYLYSFVDKEKAKTIILNLDIPTFNLLFEDMRYPHYLYEDGFVNKLEYLYGYETFVRYVPIDIGLTLYLKDEGHMTPKYHMKTSIENIGNISLDTEYGEGRVKMMYLTGQTVSPQATGEDMVPRMKQRLDTLLSRLEIEKYKDIDYTVILPPYSVLYWYNAKREGYYDTFRDFVNYILEKTEGYENLKIVFFFDAEETADLNHYSDITHFDPVLSDMIMENINNPDYVLNSSNIEERLNRLDSLVNKFTEDNNDWLPKIE